MNGFSSLTRQETRVLIALSSGSLYKEIAYDHKISINTVKKHLKNIYRKLEVSKRTQAIEKFLQFASQNDGHKQHLQQDQNVQNVRNNQDGLNMCGQSSISVALAV